MEWVHFIVNIPDKLVECTAGWAGFSISLFTTLPNCFSDEVCCPASMCKQLLLPLIL